MDLRPLRGTLSIGGNQDFVGDVNIASGSVLNLMRCGESHIYRCSLWRWGCAQGFGQWADAQWCKGIYSGETRVSGGSLTVTGSLSDSTNVDVQAGTYRLGSNDTIASLSGSGSVDLNGNQLTVATPESTQATFSGSISGTGTGSQLIKSGAGRLTLSEDNPTIGSPSITGGTLSIAGNQDFVGNVNIATGAVLEFDTAAANRIYTGVLSGAGDVLKVSANGLTLNGANTYSGEPGFLVVR